MKEYFNDWTLFEKILWIGSLILVSLVGIFFKSDVFAILYTLVDVTAILLLAKGKCLGQVLGLISCCLYIYVSWISKYYGEILVCIFLLVPMYVCGLISWLRHHSNKTDTVEINDIKGREWLIVCLLIVPIFLVVYKFLDLLNTDELFLSSISIITSLIPMYLSLRRSKYYFYFYMINDVVIIILWGLSILKGNILLLPMVFNPSINLINDAYGVYNWCRLEKIQKEITEIK